MGMTMHVDIVSLEEKIFSGRSEALFATCELGEIGVFPGHSPFLSSLKKGYIRVKLSEDEEEEVYYVSGGIIEVQSRTVTILADTIVRAANLDEAAAIEAKERAEKALADKKSDFEYARAQAELLEAMAQIQAIQKLRKKYKV